MYEIDKKNGGRRTICHPAKEIKRLQRWLNDYFISKYKVHSSVFSYREKISILELVEKHVEHRYFLKLDFKNFFPSISKENIAYFLKKNGSTIEMSERDIEDFTNIVCYEYDKFRKALTIGAPSSPILSNVMLFDFDENINDFCIEHDITYTRYADDLIFSTNEKNVLERVKDKVSELLKSLEGLDLKLNEEKTQYLSKKSKVRILGLIITTDGKVSIGRDQKRYIKSLMNSFQYDLLEQDQVFYLKGYLAFLSSVDPAFFISLTEKYGEAVIHSVKRYSI